MPNKNKRGDEASLQKSSVPAAIAHAWAASIRQPCVACGCDMAAAVLLLSCESTVGSD